MRRIQFFRPYTHTLKNRYFSVCPQTRSANFTIFHVYLCASFYAELSLTAVLRNCLPAMRGKKILANSNFPKKVSKYLLFSATLDSGQIRLNRLL